MQSHRRVGKDLATSLERLEVEASRLEVAEKAAACENATWKWKQLVFFCSCLFLFFVVVVVAAMQVVVVVFFFFLLWWFIWKGDHQWIRWLAKFMFVCHKLDPKYAFIQKMKYETTAVSCCVLWQAFCLSRLRPPWLKTTGSMRTGAAAVHSMQRLSTPNSARCSAQQLKSAVFGLLYQHLAKGAVWTP